MNSRLKQALAIFNYNLFTHTTHQSPGHVDDSPSTNGSNEPGGSELSGTGVDRIPMANRTRIR